MSRYFWPIFKPSLLSHFVTHPGIPPRKVRHTSRTLPQFLVVLVQKTRTKAPCTNSLVYLFAGVFVRGVLSEDLLSGRFCPWWFFPFPLLSECICYNRKLNITVNFMFH